MKKSIKILINTIQGLLLPHISKIKHRISPEIKRIINREHSCIQRNSKFDVEKDEISTKISKEKNRNAVKIRQEVVVDLVLFPVHGVDAVSSLLEGRLLQKYNRQRQIDHE